MDGVELPYDVGTVATITEAERAVGGRYNITAVGMERFAVRALTYDIHPYLVGHVEPLPPEAADSGEATILAAQMRPLVEKYLSRIGDVIDRVFAIEPYPDAPASIAFLTAILLQIPNHEKQELLSIARVPDMLRKEMELLDHENMIMKFLAENRYQMPPLVEAISGVFSLS